MNEPDEIQQSPPSPKECSVTGQRSAAKYAVLLKGSSLRQMFRCTAVWSPYWRPSWKRVVERISSASILRETSKFVRHTTASWTPSVRGKVHKKNKTLQLFPMLSPVGRVQEQTRHLRPRSARRLSWRTARVPDCACQTVLKVIKKDKTTHGKADQVLPHKPRT